MVGYRWFTTSGVKPLYPFGFGLSYTSFEYSGFQASGDSVELTVTNTGNYAGREVVQIYVEKPALSDGRPARELCAYAKTATLAPGESQKLVIPLKRSSIDPLAQWTPDGWKVAPGVYRLHAAASYEDIRASIEIER